VEQDVPPFLTVAGDRARVRAVNRVGLERAGISDERVRALKKAFWWLYRRGETLSVALRSLPEGLEEESLVAELVGFLREGRQ
jgi:UDP-N-acetylglucosamine acyltransferase